MNDAPALLSLAAMSARLGVRVAWLAAEVDRDRVPYLRAGRVLLFNPYAVELVLLERAAREPQGQPA